MTTDDHDPGPLAPEERETGKPERTALYGKGKRYRPHFRDPSGREVTKAFDRKIDAQRWLDEHTVTLVHGSYVHPERSRLPVGQWAETWLTGRAHVKPKTLASCRSLTSTRVLPTWSGCRCPRWRTPTSSPGWPGCGPGGCRPAEPGRRTTS